MTAPLGRVFFMHVAKTGGSSVNAFFRRRVGRRRSKLHAEHDLGRFDPARYRFLSGHIRLVDFAPHDPGGLFAPVTVLRDPVQHLASHLSWVARQAADPGMMRRHPEIGELSRKLNGYDLARADAIDAFLGQLAGERERAFFDNCQLRYLVTAPNAEPIADAHAEEAIATLRRFAFVGVTEQLDRGLACLARLFDLAAPRRPIRANANPRKPVDPADPAVREVLAAYTAPERRVYDRASAAFEDRAARLGVEARH